MTDKPLPPAESRSPNSPMLGKASREVKFRIDEDTGDLLQKKADRLGLTLSEYLRERSYIDVYGIDHVQSMAKRRLEMVAGISPTSGPESGDA